MMFDLQRRQFSQSAHASSHLLCKYFKLQASKKKDDFVRVFTVHIIRNRPSLCAGLLSGER